MIRHFLEFLWCSKRIHRIQNPFVREFGTKVLPHKTSWQGREIEELRESLHNSQQVLPFQDYGAGTRLSIGHQRKYSVGLNAQRSARRYYQGELLYRICRYYQPKRCLEFGTNLGISALYQISGLDQGQFITMEGAAALAELAQKHLNQFNLTAEVLTGEFSEILEKQINLSEYQPDYVFLDGNHQYEATLKYIDQLLPVMPSDSILMIDDINWSVGMRKAWKEIILRKEVTISVDLFAMGICFIKKSQPKEDFAVFWPGLFNFIV